MTGRRETLSRLSSPSRKPGPPLPLGPPQADLSAPGNPAATPAHPRCRFAQTPLAEQDRARAASRRGIDRERMRSEEHTSELQSLMRTSYAVFCLKKKNKTIVKNKTMMHT